MAAKYNTASAIAGEIWQYRTGGSLTVFDKDHDTAEEGRSQVRQKQRPFWLPWRIGLVGWGNQIEGIRFLFSPFPPMPPLWPPKRKYNAASAIADEIWQYHTGGSLMVFGKDHDTAEEGRYQVH